jgi:hypothetical protein
VGGWANGLPFSINIVVLNEAACGIVVTMGAIPIFEKYLCAKERHTYIFKLFNTGFLPGSSGPW